MEGKHQFSRKIEIDASAAAVWAVIADSSQLPEWAPPVSTVTLLTDGPEAVGTTRSCEVEFGSRTGTLVERCVEFTPEQKAGYVVAEDSLGFTKLFADYGFTLRLTPSGAATTVQSDTYYRPRKLMTRAMNALVMRRKFATTIEEMLQGLKQTVEHRPAEAATP